MPKKELKKLVLPQDKPRKRLFQSLFHYKPTKIFWILCLLFSGYLIFANTPKVALSESDEKPQKESDILAIAVNSITIVGTGLTIVGAIWMASQEFSKIQSTIKEDFGKDISTLTTLITTKSDEGFKRELILKQELTDAIKSLDTLLSASTNNNALAIAQLRHDMDKAMSTNLQEILKVHSKFEIGLYEIESGLEAQQTKYEQLREKMESNDALQQQQYVNLQKELQHLLRGFHRRLADLEKVIEKKLDYTPREDPVNLDIEGMG